MNPDRLKEYIKLMEENDLSELEIEEGGKRIRLKKKADHTEVVTPPAAVTKISEPEGAGEAEKSYLEIKAPMVGTFYRAPSPGAK
ncbi:MAG: acetyl-CoA carboxylase biotin carboxyl carrier protein, partial [Candidatus Omnitrophica bacterium]|nr:acetyl-CoA carboxylase biotin carboxyl carrier protein [Candidatus Omnitrophota bacterium]MBD3269661.1 acetyl-CoA carboxylase biotin carboxyl carrier protein [Candidatus Omnitrophota bacterium]